MNILEQIFKLENPKLEYKISEEVYDLLFDWFNESKISISTFETEFFEPIIKVYRTLENENSYFENYYEQARRDYYLKFAFMFLIYRYTNNDFLKRFFLLNENNSVPSDVIRWYSHATLEQENPDLFRPLTIGSQLAAYYHAIHARIDQNLTYLPCNFAQIKFQKDEIYFSTIFDYVVKQTFEEKPHLLFLLYKSTQTKRSYEIDENGKYIEKGVEIITISLYDRMIQTAFEDSIQEYNQLYKARLKKDIFILLKEFLFFKSIDKKAKLHIDNFEEAKIFIAQTKGHELPILEHIIYFISNEYLSEEERYWQVLLAGICDELKSPIDWLEHKIDFLLSKNEYKNEIKNSKVIFYHIITPLFINISNQLKYENKIVQKYEEFIYKKTKITPYQKGLEILKTIASNSMNNEQEQSFTLSKFNPYWGNIAQYSSYLTYDEKDKKIVSIKAFVDDLNYILQITLKQVHKQTNFSHPEEGNDSIFLTINYKGNDIKISKFNFVNDINNFLETNFSPYRLVAIPLSLTELGWNNHSQLLFSLAFMNFNEYEYFSKKHLTDYNIQKWFTKTRYNDFERFKMWLLNSTSINPSFINRTDLSFFELKKSKQNIGKETENDKNNHFLSDVNWEWFKVKYIDELSSKEQWYEIMNVICQCPKGKKPTTSWIADLRKEIEKLGTEKYFKELQVLFSLSLKEESWFFDVYANALKGLIWSCAYIDPNDLSLSILKTITEFSYTKIHGIGAKSTITGNLALEALITTQKEEAFGILNIMRNKTKYNKFVVALEKSIDRFKENSTIPEQLLADKSIPSFGFKNGEKLFEIADYKVIVRFQKKKLIKNYEDNDGNNLKQLPVQISNDHAKILKEINEEIKQINSIFNDLSKRIKTYWLYDRSWIFSDWSKYIKSHDLIYPHIENLIWTNKTQNKDFIVLDNQTLDADNKHFISNLEDEICLWHPVENNEDNISQWQNYLWANKIVQSQRQAFRENYPFSKTELDLLETPRFAHHFLDVNKLMAIANNTGWIFTYVHEGVSYPRVYIKPLNVSVHLICDYDRYSFAVPTKQIYFTKDNSTKINDYRPKQNFEIIKLSEIPLVTLSEICRDIDLFIATTSIANNVELSENRQEYESYRTEYQKGLFSDNANAKIRRQIIEKISPILKLNVEKFEGNFVIINGKSDTYKINLNSGFAQSSETQKHVNLIPNTSKLKSDKKLRLPIEDDETLYIILAKIMHLQTI